MKFGFKSMLFTALSAVFFSIAAQAQEQVVATVNGIPILQSQVNAIKGKSSERAATDKIIDDILVQQAISQSKVKANPAEINRAVENIAAQNGLTYGQFLDALDYQGVSLAAFKQQIAQQMIMGAVRNHAIQSSIDVTREEVEALAQKLMDEEKAKGKTPKVTAKEYEVRHILLKLNPLLNDAQAKAQLSQIRTDILSGKTTFAKAALDYSKDYLSGANGGSLGFAFPETYVPQFASTVQHSKIGTISQPFKTEFGWHILEVTNTRDGDRTLDAYRQKAYEQLATTQLQEAAKDWVKALRKNADIQYLAQ